MRKININDTLVKKIYEDMKEKIVNLKLDFGKRIEIKKMIEEYGVSQTPIREVLNMLMKDGLVINKTRRGYFIVDITPTDMSEIYDLRIMMESYALRKGILSIKRKKIEELLESAREMVQEPVQPYKPKKYIDMDRELHLLIINSANNGRLRDMYLHIYPFVEISQQLDPSYERSMKEHIAIMESIIKGDLQKAVNFLNEHITNCKNDGLKIINSGFSSIKIERNKEISSHNEVEELNESTEVFPEVGS